jgi:hypothetical protein
LSKVAGTQPDHIASAAPAGLFLRLLSAALASGRAHLANPDGNEPEQPERWGWRLRTIGTGDNARAEWQSQGHRIGWVDGPDVYLNRTRPMLLPRSWPKSRGQSPRNASNTPQAVEGKKPSGERG